MSIVAVVLAGGSSRRLGSPKQLVVHGGRTLVRAAAEEARASGCDAVRVVVGAADAPVRAALLGLDVEVTSNPDWEEGMSSSVRAGVARAEADGHDAALLLLCDQPALTSAHLRRLVEAHRRGGAVVASAYAGLLGVPAVFPRRLFPALLALRGDEGARALLRGRARPNVPILAVDWPDGACDVDTPEDLARLV